MIIELSASDMAKPIPFAPEIGTVVKYDDGAEGTVFREAPAKLYNGTIIRTWSVKITEDQWRALFKLEQAH